MGEIFQENFIISTKSEEGDNPECDSYPDRIYLESDLVINLPDWIEGILTVGNILVLLTSTCGNLGAMFIVYKSKATKVNTKLLIMSLAITDFFLPYFSCVIELGKLMNIYRYWIFGSFLCETVAFFQVWLIFSNAMCITAITFERYDAIVRSFKRDKSRCASWPGRLSYFALGLIWLFPIIVALPNLWYYELYSFWTAVPYNATSYIRPRNETCENYYFCLRSGFDKENAIYFATIGSIFILLLVSFLFCYFSIVYFLKNHQDKVKRNFPVLRPPPLKPTFSRLDLSIARRQKNRSKRYSQSFKLIISLIVIYLLCRAPIWIFNIITYTKKMNPSLTAVCIMHHLILLSNLNCSLNPIVYAFWNNALKAFPSHITQNDVKEKGLNFKKYFSRIHGWDHKSVAGIFRRINPDHYDINKAMRDSNDSTNKFYMSDRSQLPLPCSLPTINFHSNSY